MIINTNLRTPQSQTIDYIRSIAKQIDEDREIQDSLVLSNTQSEQHTVKDKIPPKQKKKPKSVSVKYISPYRQKGISIKNITKTKNKSPKHLACLTSLTLQQQAKKQSIPKNHKAINLINRYMNTPSLLEKLAKQQLDKMKQQAHQIYQNQRKQKQEINEAERKMKWADFLLRERKWEQIRENKLMEAKHKAICQQKQYQTHFVAKEYPRMDVVEKIRKVRRQKIKLNEKLRQLQPNYLSWRNHKVLNKYRSPRLDQEQKKKQIQSHKRICLSNQKQMSFLLNR